MIKMPDSELDLFHLSPEIRSYLYQTILEFEPFTTPNTLITVISKDVTELIKKQEEENYNRESEPEFGSDLEYSYRGNHPLSEDRQSDSSTSTPTNQSPDQRESPRSSQEKGEEIEKGGAISEVRTFIDPRSYRIVISLSDGSSKIESEGIHLDLFTAIRMAKEKMLQILENIQDQVISSRDRQIQIRSALDRTYIH